MIILPLIILPSSPPRSELQAPSPRPRCNALLIKVFAIDTLGLPIQFRHQTQAYAIGNNERKVRSMVVFGKSMSAVTENESWIVDRGGLVVEKKAQSGADSLNDWEQLVYCLWLADTMMRNAGDFANAVDMCPDFQRDAKRLAKRLSLPLTSEAFGLSRRKLQREYFERFEPMCNEIRSAEPGASPNGGPARPLGTSGAGGGGRHR